MKVLKGGNGNIEIPGDDVILSLELTRSGRVNLQAPTMHPSQVCKLLFNLVVDLMFGSFQSQESSSIVRPEISQ
jgi:hypothetical protein